MSPSKRITPALRTAVQEGVFPGAVFFVRLNNIIRFHEAVGLTSILPSSPAARVDTLYDLASLTKPLATTTGILCLVQDGLIHLNQTVGSILQTLSNSPVGQATIRDLLGHCSGLPAWRPYYKQVDLSCDSWFKPDWGEQRREFVLDKIAQEPLEYQLGSQTLYSDLGFILLGFVIEAKTHRNLAQYCHDRIFNRLGATPLLFAHHEKSGFNRKVESCDIAPTEQDQWRGKLVHGEVHDENAYMMGGVAGHAGLFGTAEAVAALTGSLVRRLLGSSSFS